MAPDANPYDPTAAQYRAAAEWLYRLREPGRSSLTGAFEAWKAQHPAHEFAFQEMETLFQAAAEPAAAAAEQERKARRRPLFSNHSPGLRRSSVGAGLAFAAGLALAVTVRTGIGQRGPWGADAATRPGQTRTLTLADGSLVTLNTRSAIDTRVSGRSRGVILRSGEAYFQVARDPSRPFVVEAGQARIQVVGTRFNVRLEADQARVDVDQGHVRVAPLRRPDLGVDLIAGQEALVDARAAQRQALDPVASGAWRRRQIVFYQRPLRGVVDELNRYRTAPILVVNPQLADKPVSGIFSTMNTDQAVRIIERTLDVRAARLPFDVTIIY